LSDESVPPLVGVVILAASSTVVATYFAVIGRLIRRRGIPDVSTSDPYWARAKARRRRNAARVGRWLEPVALISAVALIVGLILLAV
jgi:hypothetical protein